MKIINRFLSEYEEIKEINKTFEFSINKELFDMI